MPEDSHGLTQGGSGVGRVTGEADGGGNGAVGLAPGERVGRRWIGLACSVRGCRRFGGILWAAEFIPCIIVL